MQNLVRGKTIGVTGNGGRGTAGAGPGRDLLYTGFQNYSLIRSKSCSCYTCCFGLVLQHQNLQDFIKTIRALIKDIFLQNSKTPLKGKEFLTPPPHPIDMPGTASRFHEDADCAP